MERLTLAAEIKAGVGDEGVIEGYGSVFGVTDRGGDVVEKGAFAGSLGRVRPKMLWQHDPAQVLGVWDAVEEDDAGLRVRGRINLGKQLGRDVLSDVKMGAIGGMSIGYRTRKSAAQGNARLLKEVDLWEVSLVTFPMNEMAMIDAVKAAEMSPREMEQALRDAGFSSTVAKRLMAGGYKALTAMRDAGDGLDEIAALLRARIASKTHG
jgi:HK97 family phage prohead protease